MLTVTNVVKSYDLGRSVLNGVSFALNKGEMAFLVGPSGAGKTTLLRLVYREEAPDSGKITLGAFDVTKLRPRQVPGLRRKLGVVFQDFKLIAERTAWENVALALEVIGKSNKQIATRVTDLLRLTGLLAVRNNYPHQLSGGECQRVALARALANEPLILLADEPTGNLDSDNSQSLLQLLRDINIRGCTVLMATHNFGLIERLPYRKLYLARGVISRPAGSVPGGKESAA